MVKKVSFPLIFKNSEVNKKNKLHNTYIKKNVHLVFLETPQERSTFIFIVPIRTLICMFSQVPITALINFFYYFDLFNS
ncbi:MAG: hypothetical protein ACI9EK_003001 [Psychroserpens sp.]|jgi:hypothetical protein